MKKMVVYLTTGLLMVGVALITGCAQQSASPAKEEVKAASEPAIVSTPGYYEDKNLGFSMKYHVKSLSVVNELKEQFNEVLSVSGPQKVPALTIQVADAKNDVALENIGESTLEWFKKNYPDSTRFRIVESKMVKMESGMDANSTMFKWKYQGTVPLYTACLSAYKNGKSIQTFVTSVPGQPPAEILTKMAMQLNVMP